MTDEYLQPRNAGPLPEGYNPGPLRTLARKECADWQGGDCLRTSEACLLKGGTRCRWMETVVLIAEGNGAIAAEYENALQGITVTSTGQSAAKQVRRALTDLLQERKSITAGDVITHSGLRANAVHKHMRTEARRIGLNRRGEGRTARYSRPRGRALNVPVADKAGK